MYLIQIVRKTVALLLILLLLIDTNVSFALTLDTANIVSSGISQVPLSEQKIQDISTYLFQNRSPISTSTLFEASGSQFVELDSKKPPLYNLTSSGATPYNFSYGKSLYDANIAIVDLPTTSSGRYTYEAPYYCDLLISSLAKFTKIGNNICLPNYTSFNTAYTANNERTYVSVIKTDEIKTADLSHFGILIFPDIILGKHADILDSFGSGGIDKIKTFVRNGGVVYFSSKSLILSDKMQLTNKVVDENTLIKHHENQGEITFASGSDFTSQVLNTGLYEGKNYSALSGSGYYDYLVGSYFLHTAFDPAVVPVRYFNIAEDANYYFQDLTTLEDASLDAANNISAFYKPYEKGLVVYNGGNSLFSPQLGSHKLFINHTLNSILLSFMRDLYASAKVVQKSNPDIGENLVPALERNIILQYSLDVKNVYNVASTNLRAVIDIASGGLLIDGSIPSECQVSSGSGQIICTRSSLGAGTVWNIAFGLRVDEPTFTQAGTNIEVTRTHLYYTDSRGIVVDQNLSKQTIDAAESANLRAALNIDPAGYYPLKGEGVYIDQVLNTENKGTTEAMNVRYSVNVPLISPLFDENDQNMLISRLIFAKDYHNMLVNPATKTNVYPMQNTGACAVTIPYAADRCKDYVIPKLFPTASVLVDNYDEPVLRAKTDMTDAWVNITQGVLNPDLGGNILKQTFLPDADSIFMHAAPRRMIYQYPTKKELLFARQDVYFYNNPAYPLPHGATGHNQFISIEKNTNCTKVPGVYGYPDGIIAGEYPNSLDCNPTGAGVSWVNNKISWDNLPVGMEQSSWLYPIAPENNIASASDLAGFDANGNYIGQQNDAGTTSQVYPIKYVQGSYGTFYLPERSTPKGGYIEFDLPSGVTASKAYILADHITVTNTEVVGQTVRAYFYRGKMPNEQSLKSIVGVGLMGVNSDVLNVPVKVYSLKYNLAGNPINKYDLETTITTNFSKYSFLELPAVKLAFDLPRRKRIRETNIASIGLTEGQVNVLFSRPEYYSTSLVFVKNTLGELSTLMTQAGLNQVQKDTLSAIFTTTPTESYVRKFENLQPFVRFGTYIQELAFHRTVWGTAEDHPISDPGIMADHPMFANVGNIGMSPIPFKEYLTTGKAQIIPMATDSTRIDYMDIFGRSFAAPIRTTIPEAVPLPPPLKNFMMNTTYEMYDQSGKRVYAWDGSTELEIRQNIKLYNNYPKFFDPTICGDNPSSPHYGTCWDGTGSVITGYNGQTNYTLTDHVMTPVDFYWTQNVDLFTTKASYDSFMSGLQIQMSASGSNVSTGYTVQTLARAVDGVGNIHLAVGEKIDDMVHNYSPEVETYYPAGYIGNSMWNLTHFDYDDSVFSKGYPYHMDNLLPNPSSSISLPHNILAIPIHRGTSYKMKYFSEEPAYLQYETANNGKIEHNVTPYTSWKYTGRTGWWGENLQNSDTTLLAGQGTSNDIPYAWNGNDYLKPALINASDFTQTQTNNVYSCLFNPGTLRDIPGKYVYKPNVVQNNIIPMIPWIQKENENASYLSNYACNGAPYTASTMPKVNNIVETESAFWLYFASNLRGEAKEGMNIINHLLPFPGQSYEGDMKAIEGGRFTYWNPGLGPNAFEIVDNPVSVIKTVSSDLSIEKELLPYTLKNYKTDAYLLYTLKDPGELFTDTQGRETPRPWKDEIYTDSRGDGNYSSSVYVGVNYNGSAMKSLLRPGDRTVVGLDIYNNSGYDWAMIGSGSVANNNGQFTTYISGGIDFTIAGNQALNANDLLSKVARNVLKPTAYNFLTLNIPVEIQPYVHVAPSDANIRTTGTFFDFDFVNITTIRDGFKGSYYLDITIDPTIPDNLRSKVYAISATLNPDYFNRLPGVSGKDPVAWPDVPHLPDLKFALADGNGNAFYRNGYSTGITLDVAYNSGFTFDSAQEINDNGLLAFRLAAGDGTNKHRRLREVFESLTNSGFSLHTFTPTVTTTGSDSIASIGLASGGINEFPYINASGSIVPKTYILVHLKRDSLTDGEHQIESSDTLGFTNFAGVQKSKTNTTPLTGYAQGPKLDISYRSALIGATRGDILDVQKLTEGDNTVEVKLFLKNTGTDIAFNPTLRVHVATGVTIDPVFTQNALINGNEIVIHNLYSSGGILGAEGEAVGPGITNYFPVYLAYSGAYQDTPLSLVNDAAYEFTPYDPILPALTGSYSTGYSLDFVKTAASYVRSGIDTTSLSLSGNTVGIYWDVSANSVPISVKETNTGSELLVKNVFLDPTRFHLITTTSYFRTKTGDFKKIQDSSLLIPKEDLYLTKNSALVSNSNTVIFSLATNKLGRHDGMYDVTTSQGDIFTGTVAVPNNGTIAGTITNIDATADTTVTVNLSGSGNTFLTGTTFTVAGVPASITNGSAVRNGNNIHLLFKTNKLKDTCYKLERDTVSITQYCLGLNAGITSFSDTATDVFADHRYTVNLYPIGQTGSILSADILYISPNPNTSSIPVKILSTPETQDVIAFQKVKDFTDIYKIEGTPVQYVVKMRTATQENMVQKSSDGTVQVNYGTGQTIYAGADWSKILSNPVVSTGSSVNLPGYTVSKEADFGGTTTPFVLENYARITFQNVWTIPDRVTAIHNGVMSDIENCGTNSVARECWQYDVNKVYIYTKKFSKYILSTKNTLTYAGGGGGLLSQDSCPNGDHSPGYYDGICSRIVSGGADGKVLSSEDKKEGVKNISYGKFFPNNPIISSYDFTENKRIPQKVAAELNFFITKLTRIVDGKAGKDPLKKLKYYEAVQSYLENRMSQTPDIGDKRIIQYLSTRFIVVSKGLLKK